MTPIFPTALEEAAKAYRNAPDEEVTAITAAITAYLAQAGKEGWVMVPKEPTEAMSKAGFLANIFTNKHPCGPTCISRVTMPADKAYRAMIAERG